MYDMMCKKCRCMCHWYTMVMGMLASISGIGFFIVLFRRELLLGWSADMYFMAAIVLAIMAHGGKFCRCHWGHGCGRKGCETCGMMDKDMMMDKGEKGM